MLSFAGVYSYHPVLDKYVEPADFSLTTSTVMFVSGDTGATVRCIDINLVQDQILEGDETFTVSISNFGGAGTGAITSATVTINDDDG